MRAKSENLGYVQQRVTRGEYRVHAPQVAEAMLQRIGAIILDRELGGESDRDRASARSRRRAA